jgi:hypothetical protein
MSTFWKNAARTGIPFGIFMGFYQGLASHPPSAAVGVIAGTASGVLFGGAMAAFMQSQTKKAALLREEFTAEGLLFDAAANLGAKGGWLFLTKRRLVFVPHKLNIGAKRVELELPAIAAMRELTGMRRGVEIGTTDTQRYTFVVTDRAKWIESVGTAVADAGGNVKTLSS